MVSLKFLLSVTLVPVAFALPAGEPAQDWQLSPVFGDVPNMVNWFNDRREGNIKAGTAKAAALLFGGTKALTYIHTELSDGTSLQHGQLGQDSKILIMASDDYLNHLKLCKTKSVGVSRIVYAKATTSKGHAIEIGPVTNNCMEFWTLAGLSIVGFEGKTEIDGFSALRAIAARNPS